jgi:hypothetical protein
MVGAILANPEKFHAKAKLFGILFVFWHERWESAKKSGVTVLATIGPRCV